MNPDGVFLGESNQAAELASWVPMALGLSLLARRIWHGTHA